jgi:hypothetical protein
MELEATPSTQQGKGKGLARELTEFNSRWRTSYLTEPTLGGHWQIEATLVPEQLSHCPTTLHPRPGAWTLLPWLSAVSDWVATLGPRSQEADLLLWAGYRPGSWRPCLEHSIGSPPLPHGWWWQPARSPAESEDKGEPCWNQLYSPGTGGRKGKEPLMRAAGNDQMHTHPTHPSLDLP